MVLLKEVGHSTPNTVKNMFLAPSEAAAMLQPNELSSIASGSKLWDWGAVSLPAAYLQTLCANARPCFGVTMPIIFRVHFLIRCPTSTDLAALRRPLQISCNENSVL